MFTPEDILYEDNHLLIVNKRCGDLVQPDPSGESALEDQIKAFVKRRDAKPGDVFQFMRQGYFCVDKKSNCDNIIFNLTVALNSSWGK